MNTRGFQLIAALVAVIIFALTGVAEAKRPPIGMLMQVKGDVQYTKNGTQWKKVRRNKFVFAGTEVKTGGDGTVIFVNQTSNMTRTVAANSHFKVNETGAEVIAGTLSEPIKAQSDLSTGLSNRFKKAQRYTTVRRSVQKKKKVKLITVRKITLSPSYPHLVWNNVGSNYAYKLHIDGKAVDIASTKNEMIRHSLKKLTPGEHNYRIEVVKEDQSVYLPKRTATVTMLSQEQEDALKSKMALIKQSAPDDDFILASYLDESGLTVAAMDLYRKYFIRYPGDNDMRPMLIKAYHDLKLNKLKKAEAIVYNQMLEVEG